MVLLPSSEAVEWRGGVPNKPAIGPGGTGLLSPDLRVVREACATGIWKEQGACTLKRDGDRSGKNLWSCADSCLPLFLASGDHRPGHSGGGVGAGLAAEGALPSPTAPPAGDPAGPAPAAQHGGPVPAADVCSPAAAPHAADGGLAAAAPQQRPAPEPGGGAAGETEDAAKGSGGGGRCPAPPTQSLTASSWNPCEVCTTVICVLQQMRREALGGSDLPRGPQSS